MQVREGQRNHTEAWCDPQGRYREREGIELTPVAHNAS